jgi:hypothetical protein
MPTSVRLNAPEPHIEMPAKPARAIAPTELETHASMLGTLDRQHRPAGGSRHLTRLHPPAIFYNFP